jgi:CelD/BcsL family acetyltransferase involved in cellulose biosynthesis
MDTGEKVTLRRISDGDRERWDSIVDASPHGSVFQTWDFASAMGRYARMILLREMIKPVFHPLIAEHNGRDIGLVPLYEFKGRFLTYVFSPPPQTFVTYQGPCLNFPKNLSQSSRERLHRGFQNSVNEYITDLGAHCTRIRPPPGFDDARPYLWLGYEVTPVYNYVIDLRRPVDEIFQDGEPNFRNKVRRTEKEGYSVSEGSFDDVERLYRQQQKRYTEQGLSFNLSLDYLRDLWEHVPKGRLRILKIERNDEYVNASIEAYFKGRVVGWIGNTKVQSAIGSPNDLLFWETVNRSASEGFIEYENIWANDERLNTFKTKLNPSLNMYYSVVRMNRTLSLAYGIKRFISGGKAWGAGL